MINIITSPLSMYACLAMVAEGSTGKTFKELADVFGYTTEAEIFDAGMLGAMHSLFDGGSKGVALQMANMLFCSSSCPLKAAYASAVVGRHRATAENVDFGDSATKRMINQRIEKSTSGLIKDCVKKLDAKTVCVLVNTMYFKGVWKMQFNKKNTQPHNFQLADGKNIKVKFMNEKVKAALFTASLVKYLALPYEGDKIKFVVEMPNNRKLTGIDTGAVINIASETSLINVRVSLPKFKIRFRVDLLPILQDLGVKGVLRGTCMKKITEKPVLISQALHEAFIQVDEGGTEAAAATVAVMGKGACVPPSSFKAASPFYFHIVDSSTSTILLTGAVQKPEFKQIVCRLC